MYVLYVCAGGRAVGFLTMRPFSSFFLILYLSLHKSLVLIYHKTIYKHKYAEWLVVIIIKVSVLVLILYNVLNINYRAEASFTKLTQGAKMLKISSTTVKY